MKNKQKINLTMSFFLLIWLCSFLAIESAEEQRILKNLGRSQSLPDLSKPYIDETGNLPNRKGNFHFNLDEEGVNIGYQSVPCANQSTQDMPTSEPSTPKQGVVVIQMSPAATPTPAFPPTEQSSNCSFRLTWKGVAAAVTCAMLIAGGSFAGGAAT